MAARAAVEIAGRRDKESSCRANPTGDQSGIADLSDTDLKINPLFDEIAEPVVQDKVN
jgi:hypothetical protein